MDVRKKHLSASFCCRPTWDATETQAPALARNEPVALSLLSSEMNQWHLTS